MLVQVCLAMRDHRQYRAPKIVQNIDSIDSIELRVWRDHAGFDQHSYIHSQFLLWQYCHTLIDSKNFRQVSNLARPRFGYLRHSILSIVWVWTNSRNGMEWRTETQSGTVKLVHVKTNTRVMCLSILSFHGSIMCEHYFQCSHLSLARLFQAAWEYFICFQYSSKLVMSRVIARISTVYAVGPKGGFIRVVRTIKEVASYVPHIVMCLYCTIFIMNFLKAC